MISVELASRLRTAGLAWSPAPGDRFVIADRGMDGEVFVISELTVDVHESALGRILRFNGTVEWALDSVEADDAVWLPREDQLRTALGGCFVRLEPAGDGSVDGWAVETEVNGRRARHVDTEAERAYARALLALLE